jgi:tetratricopeptide (TPR) repeat protein
MNSIVKKWLLAIAIFVPSTGIFAETIEKGIEFRNVGMYDLAKESLLNAIKTNPNAEAYYYLGDVYLNLAKVDSAGFYFSKTAEVNPDSPFSFIGQAKLELNKKNSSLASDLSNQAIKKDKKNPVVYVELASMYAQNKQYTDADELLQSALKVSKNNPKVFVLEGDVLASQNKIGEAISKYENAIYFDKMCNEAILKVAKLYSKMNMGQTTAYLDRIIAQSPDYLPVYIESANIYYNGGFFKKSVTAFEKFINKPGIPLSEHQTYASVLYFTGDYEKSLQQTQLVLKSEPSNFIMQRIQMYDYYELGQFDAAMAQGEIFFQSKGEKDEYIAQDYTTYAKILSKNKLDTESIVYYEKALQKDPSDIEINKDIAASYEKLEKYPESISYFQKYLNSAKQITAFDYYTLGRTYYLSGNQQAVLGNAAAKTADLQKADSLFTLVTELNSDHYLGFFWKARTAVSVEGEDLSKGLAKPMYEIAMEKMTADNADGKNNRNIIECCMYLGNYYLLNKDKVKAIEYFNKVLEITPDNQALKNAIKELK